MAFTHTNDTEWGILFVSLIEVIEVNRMQRTPLLICSLLLCSQPQALAYVAKAHSPSTETCSCLCSSMQTVKYRINQSRPNSPGEGKDTSVPFPRLSFRLFPFIHSFSWFIARDFFDTWDTLELIWGTSGQCRGQQVLMCPTQTRSLLLWTTPAR